MRLFILSFLLLFSSTVTFAQSDGITMEWASGIGITAGSKTAATGVLTDQQGNVYTYGRYEDSVDFDPGIGDYILYSNGETDIFIQKLDQNGDFVWVRSFGGTSPEFSGYITFDMSGNLILTGIFRDSVDFDPGPGVQYINANFNGDAYIMKMDPNGNLIWIKVVGGTYIDGAAGVAVNSLDQICVVGRFGHTVDFDPGPGVFNMTANSPAGQGFILKLTSGGNFIWARAAGWICGPVSFDSSNDILVYGMYDGTMDFDPGPGVYNLTATGGNDAFLLKLSGNGTFVWAKSFGGKSAEITSALSIGDSQNIYLSGTFQDTVDLDPGPGISSFISNGIEDVYIMKLNSSGNLVWARTFGGPSWERVTHTTDSIENILVTGSFQDTVDFDPGASVHNLAAAGSTYFLQKLDSSGTFEWVAAQQGGYSRLNAIHEQDGLIYGAGNCNKNIDIDPCIGVDSLLTDFGSQTFTIKFDQCSSYGSTDVITSCDPVIWIDGNTYTSSNSTATYVIPNNSGCCDSVITLDLTINIVDNGIVQVDDTTLQASSTGAQYQWLDCDNNFTPIFGQTNQIFYATSNGNYAVQVTENGCVDTSSCVPITTVGVVESEIDGLVVSPNPTNDFVSVQLGSTYMNVEWRVYGSDGRKVEEQNISNSAQFVFLIDQSPGFYMVELRADNKRAVVKILKQ